MCAWREFNETEKLSPRNPFTSFNVFMEEMTLCSQERAIMTSRPYYRTRLSMGALVEEHTRCSEEHEVVLVHPFPRELKVNKNLCTKDHLCPFFLSFVDLSTLFPTHTRTFIPVHLPRLPPLPSTYNNDACTLSLFQMQERIARTKSRL